MAASIPADFGGDDVALSTSATLVYTASPRASASEPETVTVQNLHATAVVTVGASDVADESNGIVLSAQYDSVTVPLRSPGTEVYAIADTGTPTVSVVRA